MIRLLNDGLGGKQGVTKDKIRLFSTTALLGMAATPPNSCTHSNSTTETSLNLADTGGRIIISQSMSPSLDRRMFLQRAAAGAAAFASARRASGANASELKAVHSEIDKHHDEAVHRLQEWIRQPSIAAENRGMTEGCELTMRFLRDAGFDRSEERRI